MNAELGNSKINNTNNLSKSSKNSNNISTDDSNSKLDLFNKLPSSPFDEDDELENKKTNNINRPVYKLEPKMDMIIPRLYLSDDVAARNLQLITKNNITHVLNLTTNIPNKFEPNIIYKKLIILDFESQNISQYFNEANEFIDQALAENEKNCVLVHCNAGISRSSSFVIAYLMHKKMFKTYHDALKFVRKKRPIVMPNRGFEKQLIGLERRIKRKNFCNIM